MFDAGRYKELGYLETSVKWRWANAITLSKHQSPVSLILCHSMK